MNPSERPSALTDIEVLAIEVQANLPTALAIAALDRYGQTAELDAESVERYAEAMRTMSPKRLKKLRKALNGAAKLPKLLPKIERSSEAEVAEERSLDDMPTATTAETPEIIDTQVAEPESVLSDTPELVLNDEADVSEFGKTWVLKLIPDYDFDGKTAQDIATDLYTRMGEPKTRTKDGKKIDPLERIRRRIQGVTDNEIAAGDGSTPASVQLWFRNFVNSRFKAETEPEVQDRGQSLFVALVEANFTRDEIAAVEAIIGMVESLPTDIAQDASTRALNSLQGLLVTNIDKLDADDDANAIAGLRMLTTTAFGRKTIRDVYHKLHGKDNTVTYQDVSVLLQDGIIKLAKQD